jgi:hypothetical protein
MSLNNRLLAFSWGDEKTRMYHINDTSAFSRLLNKRSDNQNFGNSITGAVPLAGRSNRSPYCALAGLNPLFHK